MCVNSTLTELIGTNSLASNTCVQVILVITWLKSGEYSVQIADAVTVFCTCVHMVVL